MTGGKGHNMTFGAAAAECLVPGAEHPRAGKSGKDPALSSSTRQILDSSPDGSY